jgi:TfoX/Sxy family transcriptional regulator of competence genes
MMKWKKSPESLVAIFDAVLPDDASVQRRQMFGYPAAFVNGNLATSLFQDDFVVRLSEPRGAALLAKPGARPFEPMRGRPMRGYVVVPPAIVAKKKELGAWVREAVAHAATLPAKTKTKAKTKTPGPKKATKARA